MILSLAQNFLVKPACTRRPMVLPFAVPEPDLPADAPEGDPRKDLAKGHLRFVLHGEKLRGSWTLARLGGRRSEDHAAGRLLDHVLGQVPDEVVQRAAERSVGEVRIS